MFNKKSLQERISGYCKENLSSLEDTTTFSPDNKMTPLLSESTQEVENLPEVVSQSVKAEPDFDDNAVTQPDQNSTSEIHELSENYQNIQPAFTSNINEFSMTQNMLMLLDGRMRYVNRPIYIQEINSYAYIRVIMNPTPTFLLFLNEQPVGDVRSEINNNDGLIFYQNGLPKGIIREGMNGWLQYISYNFQPQNQPSYFNQNYHATSATSYNFNINNIPANVEGIEAVERMLSSVIPYIPQCSKEVNISINFDGSSSTNDNVIDTTAF